MLLKILVAACIVTALVVVVLAVLLKRYNSRRRTLKDLAEDKLRDEALNSAIENKAVYQGKISHAGNSQKPIEVNYSENLARGGKVGGMLQIVEHSGISVKKYVLDPSVPITVGREKDNVICINERTLSGRHCEIFAYQKGIYVRDLGSSNHTVIVRERESAYADGNGVRIKTGDRIQMGNVFLDITVI